MALIRKLFRRNKKITKTEETSPIYAEIEDTVSRRKVAPILPEREIGHEVDGGSSLSTGSLDRIVPDGTDIDTMIESEEITKRKQLNNVLRKVRRQEERLAQRRREVVAMDNEISELMWMISLAKRQRVALDEEVLNKKCEMKFLRKEAPESCESEVRKREPLFFKKYNAIKTSSDAKNMMHTVRQRQRALQYLELMIYNKYLELQYNTKSDEVKKRSSMLSKDRSKHFGHLVEALNLRSNFEIQLHNQTSNSTGSSPLSGQVEAFTPELDDSLLSITTTESPTTALQTGSPMTTPPSGMLGSNGLLFNLAIPPRANDRSTGPLLESML